MPEIAVVEVGIAIPQESGDSCEATALAAFCAWAESPGFQSLWVSDSDTPNSLDPLTVLSHAAATTTRARIGVAVLLTALRDPLRLARELATIDQISGGRLIVGVGLGGNSDAYPRHGLSADGRVSRFDAGLRLLRALWTDNAVTSHTPWWQLDTIPRPLAPAQTPHPPLWFGARRGNALARAASLGDGWIGAGSMTPAEFVCALTTLENHLRALGRDRSLYTVGKRVYIHVHGDDQAVPIAAARWFGRHYGDEGLAGRVAVIGDPETCATHLRWLVGLGVNSIILHPVVDQWAQIELLVNEVLPLAGLDLAPL
jgi:alkanesulfonate monooxygenase SsuD/methylene tetrahydromethanopterin reductase-like flavin-dependent oxidoreductase (luciferase family)